MKDFFSKIGTGIIMIAGLILALAGPILWFIVDVKVGSKILSLFGL